MVTRVLVVDDYEAWRRQIASVLQHDRRWTIVGEAADGLEAVEQARVLQPNVILLDIGLPKLDGIETARRILARDPRCRILFLSEHRWGDIVDAAFGADACGYIVKSQAGRDLLPAMEAALVGKRFVGAGLTRPASKTAKPDSIPCKLHCHEAGLFSDETALLDQYARFAGSALEAGQAAIYVGSDARRDQMQQRLQARGIDVDRATKDGRYLALDVGAVLASFMYEGRLDEGRFATEATTLFQRAADVVGAHLRVAACGDGAATLLAEGRVEETLRLEALWNEFARAHQIDVFCGYRATIPGYDRDSDVWRRIRGVHSVVHQG